MILDQLIRNSLILKRFQAITFDRYSNAVLDNIKEILEMTTTALRR